MLFENCQSLLGEMRDVTVQVAGNIGDISPAVKVKHEPRMLELQLESFGEISDFLVNIPL